MSKYTPGKEVMEHPLFPVFCAAIEQAMNGKGKRHGGASVPFLEQPLFHYAKMHGRGFLTGQAAKKLEEAASTRHGDAFEVEVLGSMVYSGSAILNERMRQPAFFGVDLAGGPDMTAVAVVSRPDKASGYIDEASGWLKWCPLRTSCSPVAPDILVEVLLECGEQHTKAARKFDWSNSSPPTHRIKAFRIVG